MPEGETQSTEKLEELREKEKERQILFRIALSIKKGETPASYSKKAAALAEKYEGEELEKLAYGGMY